MPTALYGDTSIFFSLSRKRRKTVAIRVRQGAVEVSAPPHLTESQITTLVLKRAEWILSKQRELSQRPAPPRQYTDGESWSILGQEYRLRLESGAGESLQLLDGELRLTISAPHRAQKVLDAWLRKQALAVLRERVQACLPQAARYGLHHSGEFTLRAMRSRWGSMSSSGRMTLNLYLIHAPTECIDFVILHELCHLQEFNHSKAYYALLTKVLPDWKARRERLRRVALPR